MHKIACPAAAKLCRKLIMAHELCESNPEVGSSRKSSSFGYKQECVCRGINGHGTYLSGKFHGDSQPLPVLNTQRANSRVGVRFQSAHLKTFIDTEIHIRRSTPTGGRTYYACFSLTGTLCGCLSIAENRSASRTVENGSCVSIC